MEFNYFLRKVQVANIYYIGILKEKYTLLKEIHIQVNQRTNMKFIMDWIFACYILHNVFVNLDDIWAIELTKIG